MANNGKYLGITSGVVQEESAINVSAGAGDAGKIPKLDSAGLLPVSMLPTGVGAEVITATASEALAAGAYVNIWNSTGLKVRNADATTAGKEAHGFVLAAVSSSASATVYMPSQQNSSAAGRTVGAKQYLSTTPGTSQEAAPSSSGNVVQQLGVATSATNVLFQPQLAITLAQMANRRPLVLSSGVAAEIPTGDTLVASGGVLEIGTGGVGYGTGAGGTVTQGTSRTTGVTLSKMTGAITLFSTTTTAGLVTTFTVTNTLVLATDTISLSQKSGTGIYLLGATNVAAGSFKISVYTPAAVGSAEAPVISFNVVRGAIAQGKALAIAFHAIAGAGGCGLGLLHENEGFVIGASLSFDADPVS